VRLRAERERRNLTYTTTAFRLKAMEAGWNTAEYVELCAEAQEAELELKLLDAEIAQHQDRHAAAN
jgi:hypothetical protein